MGHSREALWWSLFSAGGVMAAIFVPALVVLTGLLLPFAADSGERYQRVYGAVSFWPVRIVLLAVIVLAFFHCAHRIRHMLMDLGWRRAAAGISVVCYGGATAGAAAAAAVLATL